LECRYCAARLSVNALLRVGEIVVAIEAESVNDTAASAGWLRQPVGNGDTDWICGDCRRHQAARRVAKKTEPPP